MDLPPSHWFNKIKLVKQFNFKKEMYSIQVRIIVFGNYTHLFLKYCGMMTFFLIIGYRWRPFFTFDQRLTALCSQPINNQQFFKGFSTIRRVVSDNTKKDITSVYLLLMVIGVVDLTCCTCHKISNFAQLGLRLLMALFLTKDFLSKSPSLFFFVGGISDFVIIYKVIIFGISIRVIGIHTQ